MVFIFCGEVFCSKYVKDLSDIYDGVFNFLHKNSIIDTWYGSIYDTGFYIRQETVWYFMAEWLCDALLKILIMFIEG